MRHTIFVVDDDPIQLRTLRTILDNRGYQAVGFTSAREMLEKISEGAPSMALVDLLMPEMNGIEVIRSIRSTNPQLPIVVVTAESRLEVAIEAIKSGANEFVRKPVVAEELSLIIQRLFEVNSLRETLTSIRSDEGKEHRAESLIGESPQIKAVRAFVARVAEYADATLLIRGESGTGKNKVARVVHHSSPRAAGRFVDINCASIPEQLLESELFGYEKGAFTDARAAKKGLFEVAEGGTVLLDEINAMSPALQAKLLTVLEQRSFRRLGGTEEIHVDVRIITTTNEDLEEALTRGAFREDLYYRVNVVSIVIPPLRERGDDVLLMARHFIQLYNAQFHRAVRDLSPEAADLFRAHRWPGNVRELRNVIEHAMIFTNSDLLVPGDFVLGKPRRAHSASAAAGPICSMEELERTHVERVLKHTDGDTVKAAAILGISRKTLWEKRKRYGLK